MQQSQLVSEAFDASQLLKPVIGDHRSGEKSDSSAI
jgi:hypothetical protein